MKSLVSKKTRSKLKQGVFSSLLLTCSALSYAGVTCTPLGSGWFPLPLLSIDLNMIPGDIPAGTTLGSGNSVISWNCNFSGSQADRTIWFNSQTPKSTKDYLTSSGVRVYQESYANVVEITAQNTPKLKVAYWNAGNYSVAFWHTFTIKRGEGPLKSFDTGNFNLGYHTDGVGNRIGDNYTIRLVGKLINYCPTPIVMMSDKVVDFKELTTDQFENNKTVKENFNLTLTPVSTCEAALEVSVKFQSNNGVVNNKYLVFDNGLQMAITDRSLGQEIRFDQVYYKGVISQQKPGNYLYSAELSKKSNESIKQGPFSNTVNILFSYK
ncbi:fimbrial protein [Providencia heimbachae]|uniref:Fimbrial-type adhesion domain-containing protein n=1 Tax=Providencia heimbachae ATCC 35613 TaxID=1354272 RepID=A0A1B7K530_9GAMM|nr:hypothetical protein [Providencia heimbachae]OAT55255.1 hypothetical protein M998_0004 [Providencia heimbachae ATCC 35613]SQH13044.1 P pilus assembly protein, pilin FimA [Providencia heimbachae]